MNFKQTTSTAAIIAVMMSAGAAFAENASTFDASVSVLSPDETGFIIGGQVSVNGLGSGALTMTRSVAEMALYGGAGSELVYHPDSSTDLAGVNSWADVTSAISFDRDIDTSGSLVGQGNVVSRGEAIAAIGSAGAASATTETGGTDGFGDAGSATAEASSQGSLNGSLSTSNTLQLLGTSGLFAGSNALSVGETNEALAYGSSDIYGTSTNTGINLDEADWDTEDGLLYGSDDGALFIVNSDLHGDDGIDISVSNAGNGTISITTSTGGFFTGGAAAAGSSTLSDTGSFFDEDV